MNFGAQEMMVVLVIVVLLFGGQKVPELMRGVGKGIGEFQKGLNESKQLLAKSLEESAEEKN